MKEFFFNFTGKRFHSYFFSQKKKKAGKFPAFFHKHLLIFEKYFGQ
jgi:hypothetical protein